LKKLTVCGTLDIEHNYFVSAIKIADTTKLKGDISVAKSNLNISNKRRKHKIR